jgi:hypothetical protein
MKKLIYSFILILTLFSFNQSIAQTNSMVEYEPTADHPFGKLNPEAPKELNDFAPMIGLCDCLSERRNQDGTWQDPINMIWKFKYIMNGMAIQDETYKADGVHSGSIRQFNQDSLQWYVHYYSSNSPTPRLSSWAGDKKEDKIVLSMPQKAPNGMDGFSRLTFYDISNNGFKWIGEWTDTAGQIAYPFWKIDCTKRKM